MTTGQILAGIGIVIMLIAMVHSLRYYPPGEGYNEEGFRNKVTVAGWILGMMLIIGGLTLG